VWFKLGPQRRYLCNCRFNDTRATVYILFGGSWRSWLDGY